MLPFGSIMESKCNNEAKKNCKVMTRDENIKILDKLRGGISTAAVDPTFHQYFILKPNFLFIFYFLA
jgi:hypothetical protein